MENISDKIRKARNSFGDIFSDPALYSFFPNKDKNVCLLGISKEHSIVYISGGDKKRRGAAFEGEMICYLIYGK